MRLGGLISYAIYTGWVWLCLFTGTMVSPALCDEHLTHPLTIRVGAYENYPKIYTQPDDMIVGIFPDILAEIAKEEGWLLTWVRGSWTQCLERLEKGYLDIMVDVAYSEERATKYDFNKETLLINWGIIYTRHDIHLNSLLDLQGKTIAVMKGSIHTEGMGGIKNLVKTFDISCAFIEVDTYHQVFELIGSGKADAGVVNRIFGSLFEQTYSVSPSSIMFNPRHLKFAFPKKGKYSAYLIEKIDAHLQRLKKTPESIYHRALYVYLSNLPREWLTNDFSPRKTPIIPLTEKEKNWIREHRTIRLGVDPEFSPFEFVGEEGNYKGIASDYVSLLNKRLGLNMQIEKGLSWKAVMDKALKGDIDILPCVDITAQRRLYFNYTKPYLSFYRVIITRIDMPFLSGLDDLKDMRVGVQANSSHEGYLKEHTLIHPISFKTLKASLLALSDGTVDALVGNVASSTYWIRKLNLTNLKVAASVSPSTHNLHMAVRKDWPELVGILNKGLISISEKEKEDIHTRWVNVDYTPGMTPRQVRKIVLRTIGGGLIILALFMVWNYGLKREIRVRKTYEEALTVANLRLQELDRLKSMFIASMSHELRTPLNSIIGFSSIVLNEWVGPLNDEQKENLETILRSGKHLLALINDVIDVSKIEAGKMDIYIENFDLADLICEATTMFSKDIEAKSIHLEVNTIHGMIHTDRRRLLQCIVNLVGNAVKYTLQGSITLDVKKVDENNASENECDPEHPQTAFVEIRVTDTGIGISEQDLKRLFLPFIRLESPIKSTVKGTGLGLYLTKKIVTDILKGTITISSIHGKGSQVFLRIPECIAVKEADNDEESACC